MKIVVTIEMRTYYGKRKNLEADGSVLRPQITEIHGWSLEMEGTMVCPRNGSGGTGTGDVHAYKAEL